MLLLSESPIRITWGGVGLNHAQWTTAPFTLFGSEASRAGTVRGPGRPAAITPRLAMPSPDSISRSPCRIGYFQHRVRSGPRRWTIVCLVSSMSLVLSARQKPRDDIVDVGYDTPRSGGYGSTPCRRRGSWSPMQLTSAVLRLGVHNRPCEQVKSCVLGNRRSARTVVTIPIPTSIMA